MRKSRLETAQTRERIVEAAAAEFREHGIVATGLADLMAAAGMTHGGFYRHFSSKDEVVAEACARAIEGTLGGMASAASGRKGRDGLKAIAAGYLSTDHRDDVRDGCPLAAIGAELARCDEGTKAEMTAGIQKMIELIASHTGRPDSAEARKRALVAASAMVGALTLSRIVSDESLSKSILAAAEDAVTGTR